MRLTKFTLKKIIKEEINKLLREQFSGEDIEAETQDILAMGGPQALQTDALALYQAMEGLGTDEDAIEKVINKYLRKPQALKVLISTFNNLDQVKSRPATGGLIKWLRDDGEDATARAIEGAIRRPYERPAYDKPKLPPYVRPPGLGPIRTTGDIRPEDDPGPAPPYVPPPEEGGPARTGEEKTAKALVRCWMVSLIGVGKNEGRRARLRAPCDTKGGTRPAGCFDNAVHHANRVHKGKWEVMKPYWKHVVPCKE